SPCSAVLPCRPSRLLCLLPGRLQPARRQSAASPAGIFLPWRGFFLPSAKRRQRRKAARRQGFCSFPWGLLPFSFHNKEALGQGLWIFHAHFIKTGTSVLL